MGFHVHAAHDLLAAILRTEGLKSSTKGNPFEWLFVASFFWTFRGASLYHIATTLGLDEERLPEWCGPVGIVPFDVTFATLEELGYRTVDNFLRNASSHPQVVLRPPPTFGPGNRYCLVRSA